VTGIVTSFDLETGKRMDETQTTAEQLFKENKLLRAQVANMLGKLDSFDNFVPRMALDLCSTMALDIEETPAGCWVRRRITGHMGS
jgi:hypothetical protein